MSKTVTIIADAGGTKTDWNIIFQENRLIRKFLTGGFNAVVSEETSICRLMEEFRKNAEQDGYEFKELKGDFHLYVAGCNSDIARERLKNAFNRIFHDTRLTLVCHSDLEGAAIGLFGNECGIACIIGTGSASGYYDGHSILSSVPSLGYILGDEGSGASMGKSLLNKYFKGELPSSLEVALRNFSNMELKTVLENVYNRPSPNRYLASFVPFIKEFETHEQISLIINDSLKLFFEKNVKKYRRISGINEEIKFPVRFVGGVAFIFSEQIKKIAEENSIRVDKFLESPVDSIVNYFDNSSTYA